MRSHEALGLQDGIYKSISLYRKECVLMKPEHLSLSRETHESHCCCGHTFVVTLSDNLEIQTYLQSL